jgi:hypothetical protein
MQQLRPIQWMQLLRWFEFIEWLQYMRWTGCHDDRTRSGSTVRRHEGTGESASGKHDGSAAE